IVNGIGSNRRDHAIGAIKLELGVAERTLKKTARARDGDGVCQNRQLGHRRVSLFPEVPALRLNDPDPGFTRVLACGSLEAHDKRIRIAIQGHIPNPQQLRDVLVQLFIKPWQIDEQRQANEDASQYAKSDDGSSGESTDFHVAILPARAPVDLSKTSVAPEPLWEPPEPPATLC